MTSILTPTTSKDSPTTVKWTTSMVDAFDMLCKCLCKNIELCIPTTDDKLVLETDASITGVGAVLHVDRGEQGMLPVAFYSSQLRGAECNYAAQELEELDLVKVIKHFSFYLYGRKFDVLTVHESLQSMMTKFQKNKRVLRWTLSLMDYSFNIIYRKGEENTVADWLSRHHDDDQQRGQQLQPQMPAAEGKIETKMKKKTDATLRRKNRGAGEDVREASLTFSNTRD